MLTPIETPILPDSFSAHLLVQTGQTQTGSANPGVFQKHIHKFLLKIGNAIEAILERNVLKAFDSEYEAKSATKQPGKKERLRHWLCSSHRLLRGSQ
jgi:hypothetical protein